MFVSKLKKKIMRKLIPILLVATIFTSCATLLRKDTKQVVAFTTNPPSATVIVDGKIVGISPIMVTLETTEPHDIQYKLNGYPNN